MIADQRAGVSHATRGPGAVAARGVGASRATGSVVGDLDHLSEAIDHAGQQVRARSRAKPDVEASLAIDQDQIAIGVAVQVRGYELGPRSSLDDRGRDAD